ncbi:effector-associated constant component EACC1 [Paractinoplanes deccanensis]|uniref:effector-associated constant component EACC1 n=1 Tax=Paractinoplanes deccanensis TaxID=113561 RepID=UPI0019411DD5|nr:hypothetical protein [Actinoplanes deccanensis]
MGYITVSSDDHGAVLALQDWLRREQFPPGIVVHPCSEEPGPDDMGAWSDGLKIVFENPGLLTAVATAVGAWVGSRARVTRVKVRDGDREIEIDSRRIKDPEQVARRIQEGLAPPARDRNEDI